MSNSILLRLALAVLLAAAASPAGADNGRLEISQAIVDAAGGFPYAIDAPGSYVLTGDLVVASDVGAIAINVLGDVTIDLNGFRIEGSSTCVLGSCGQGAAIGLSGPPFFGFGSNIAVHGGEISKFSGSCIMLGSSARVERMRVAQCGRNGIFVGGGGSVTGNLVISTGENGILLDEGSVYSHNSVGFSNLGGGGGLAIRGGRATAGNFCDDGSCSADGNRTLRWDRVLDSSNGDSEGCGSQRFECVLPTGAHASGAASLDLETGLVWDRFPSGGLGLGRRGAMDFCAKREVGGRKGWHLPMLEQLASLIDSSNSGPALPTGHPFSGISAGLYWTATADAAATLNIPNLGWTVRMGDGAILNGSELNDGPATWCVRGGRAFDGNTQR